MPSKNGKYYVKSLKRSNDSKQCSLFDFGVKKSKDNELNNVDSEKLSKTCFPRVAAMYNLALLIPQSTAVVERSFSLMNDLCTFLRTSLTTQQLGALMRINTCTPQEEDYEKIVDLFKEYKVRQLAL